MRIFRWLSEQRERQIVGFAQPHLEDDEEVVEWTRGRKPGGRQEGFAYLTSRRAVIVWTGRGDDRCILEWEKITSWGVSNHARGGPVLAMESAGEVTSVQLLVTTSEMAASVSRFLHTFAELVPQPRWSLPATSGEFKPDPAVGIEVERPSVAARTKRILVTILGVLLVLAGGVAGIIPGPGGIVLAIAGLAVLATEYDWAKDALVWARHKYRQATAKLRARRSSE